MSIQTADAPLVTIRQRMTVSGVVQGVGFRPFVYGLAQQYGLSGFVGNDSDGVFIEVQGPAEAIDQFKDALSTQAPPLAVVERVMAETMLCQPDPIREAKFEIVQSQQQHEVATHISPDVTVCEDCLAELNNPADRRYRYPFITCTNCGPRFTIIQNIPYDRPFTTMAEFTMCPACQAEYDDPADRRFHAQPNGCPDCGPSVWLEENGSQLSLKNKDVFGVVQDALHQGKILAVKGLGGFHLACDARHDAAIVELRQRKGRVAKPFAVMADCLATVEQFAHINHQERALLQSRERPIVLLRKKDDIDLSDHVAPGNRFIGVMLPYTPLHHLVLKANQVLVMTSANLSNEPIVKDNDEARKRLSQLADLFLMHNRPIENRCDDSVVRSVQLTADAPHLLPIRRSRGYAPFPVRLPFEAPSILAVGGELKGTFCQTKGMFGYMSQHVGDVGDWQTLQALEKAAAQFEKLFQQRPEILACDKHPGYLSSEWARKVADGRPVVPVQHHHAHIASVMAEHQLDGVRPVIGFAFDGTGYGDDGAVWGGEVLIADYDRFERFSHLAYTPLAGGDVSVKRPYRLALSQLWAAGFEWAEELPPVIACSNAEQKILRQQLEKNLNCVSTSSMGRLFDAVAALVGGRQIISYEGQAAIEFEATADVDASALSAYQFDIYDRSFSAKPVIEEIIFDLRNRLPRSTISAKFHLGVAELILQVSQQVRDVTGIQDVALSGGVFQNVWLLQKTIKKLKDAGFRPLIHHQVPPNDGGLALGQAVIASRKIQ